MDRVRARQVIVPHAAQSEALNLRTVGDVCTYIVIYAVKNKIWRFRIVFHIVYSWTFAIWKRLTIRFMLDALLIPSSDATNERQI